MGRLDDQAKHRIVVLRKAGLSFRKIKKVLELDNIKVTPQAIYLFLKRKNIEPEKSVVAPQILNPKAQTWEEKQLWNLLQEDGGVKEKVTPIHKKEDTGSQQRVNNVEAIKIVSVTSLSEGNQTFQPVSTNQRTSSQGQALLEKRDCEVRSSRPPPVHCPRPPPVLPMAPQQLHTKPRFLLPAPRNPALLVTKKIVDRAIHLQKKVISQNGFALPTTGVSYPPPTCITSYSPALRPATSSCTPQSQSKTVGVKDVCTQTPPVPPPPRPAVTVEQLDSMKGELHRLTQAVQTLIDRQSRWEQEQHRQQQCNHREVLQHIQQLEATLTTRSPQNCASFGSAEETETPLPDFGHFKMELL